MAKNSSTTELDKIIERNIETIHRIEDAAKSRRTAVDVVVDAIASYCGSLSFVYLHLVIFGVWLALNTVPGVPKHLRFDPPPFGMLTLVVSLEAIFLSTFILISQNRQQQLADHRNKLDLQINLLAEQETSLIMSMLVKISDQLGVVIESQEEQQIAEITDVERVAEFIELEGN
ncbi:MAG: DUF1003 domain-containing protein [Armatimonadetes bacterium]|nr:DUF1003 domain-containing protein [Armatimonadota bacterium]